MSKRIVAAICVMAVLLNCMTGCNKGGESSDTTSDIPQITSPVSSSTEPEQSQPTIDKNTWTGAQFDNPVDKEKFDTLISRVRTNLESKGIVVIGNEFLEPPEEDVNNLIIFNPFQEQETSTSTESAVTSEENSEEDKELTIEDFVFSYTLLNNSFDTVSEAMLAEFDTPEKALILVGKDKDEDALAFCAEKPDEAKTSAEKVVKNYVESLRSRANTMYAALKTFGDDACFEGELGVAWFEYIVFTSIKLQTIQDSSAGSLVTEALFDTAVMPADMYKLLDDEIVSDVMRCAYAFNPKQWYHHGIVSEIASAESESDYSKFFQSTAAVTDYDLVSDIGDWLIAPDTPADLFKNGFNNKASEWGVPNASLDKVFMGGVTSKLPTTVVKNPAFDAGADGYSTYAFRSTMEEELVLTSFVNYLYQSGDSDLKNLTAWLKDNYSTLNNKINELIDKEYHPEKYPSETEETSEPETSEIEAEPELVNPFENVGSEAEWVETILDEDGNSVVVKKLCAWLKETMPNAAYKELNSWIAVDTLDYKSLKETLANSASNLGTYGFVNSLGVCGSIVRNKELVNSYNWQLGFAIGSKMITEEQLENIVLTYVIYVGTFTNETYTRALDIALSGIINQTTNSDFTMHLEYAPNAAILYIDKA